MTSSRTVHATPIHASPEVLSSQPATELSDIYGLASSLYRLIAGTPAFYNDDDESIFALLMRIGTEEPVPLTEFGVPVRLADAVHRGMAKVPAARFPTAGDFAQELLALVRDGRDLDDHEPGTAESESDSAAPVLVGPGSAPVNMMTIDGYSDLVQVGSGGFSVVYRARETAFDRVVAIKVLAGTTWGDDVQARFERECRAIGALSSHPNIVTVYAAGRTALGAPYLVMEYAPVGRSERH